MQESRYLYSPDGLAVTQYVLPANTLPMSSAMRMQNQSQVVGGAPGPYYAKNNQKKTPAREIPPLKYIVSNNPGGVYQYLTAKGYNVKNDMNDLYRQAVNHIKKGDEAVVDLFRNCHPDIPTFVEALQVGNPDKVEMKFEGDGGLSQAPNQTPNQLSTDIDLPPTITEQELSEMPDNSIKILISNWEKEIATKGDKASEELKKLVSKANKVLQSRKDPEVIAEKIVAKTQEKQRNELRSILQYVFVALGIVVVLYILFNRDKRRFY